MRVTNQSSLETSLAVFSKRLLSDLRKEPAPAKIQALTQQLQQMLEARRSAQDFDVVSTYTTAYQTANSAVHQEQTAV